MAHNIKATKFAQRGIDIVALFAAAFESRSVNGYVPVLREPPAGTTAGGKQAVQHMILEPTSDGEPTITIGHVNVVTRTAKLRSYDCMTLMHASRFAGQPLPIDQARYQALFDSVSDFIRRLGMNIEIETRPPDVAPSSRRPPPPSNIADVLLWLGLAVAVATAAVVVYLRATGRL